MSMKILFLDRDGTINEEVNYLSRPGQLRLIPGTAEAMRHLALQGWRLFVTTNQSGIARGYMTEKDVQEVNRTLGQMLASEGVMIEGFYYCPQHPNYGPPVYRKKCECRKPLPGLIYKAAKEHALEIADALVIGDRLSDVGCGLALNGRALMVRTGHGLKESDILQGIDIIKGRVLVYSDLSEAVKAILSSNIPLPGTPINPVMLYNYIRNENN